MQSNLFFCHILVNLYHAFPTLGVPALVDRNAGLPAQSGIYCPRRHRHRSLDQSFWISVNAFQLDIASGSAGGTFLAPPARNHPASAGRGVVVHSWLDGGRHCGQWAVSAHGRIRVHSPPPFPLRPRQAGPTLFPPISCPAVLWLLGQAGNKVLRR